MLYDHRLNSAIWATGAFVDRGRCATGHVRMRTLVNANDVIAITVNGVTVTYEADGVGANVNYVRTPADIPTTTAALRAAILGAQGAVLASAVHAVDTDTIDLRVVAPGAALAFGAPTGGGARLYAQDNGLELAPANRSVYQIQRTVTAEDVLRNANGRVHIDTGLTNIRAYVLRLITSNVLNTEILYSGNITVVGGVIELDSAGGVDLAAGNIIMLEVEGD